MLKVFGKQFFKYSGSPHIGSKISSIFGRSEDSERIKTGAIYVIRKSTVQFRHGSLVLSVALGFFPLAVKQLDAPEVGFLSFGRCLADPFFRSFPQPSKYFARACKVLFVPNGMVLRHGLPPIGHGKRRLAFFG